jgi:hypothetical protein
MRGIWKECDDMIKLVYWLNGVKELIGGYDEVMLMISNDIKVLSIYKI